RQLSNSLSSYFSGHMLNRMRITSCYTLTFVFMARMHISLQQDVQDSITEILISIHNLENRLEEKLINFENRLEEKLFQKMEVFGHVISSEIDSKISNFEERISMCNDIKQNVSQDIPTPLMNQTENPPAKCPRTNGDYSFFRIPGRDQCYTIIRSYTLPWKTAREKCKSVAQRGFELALAEPADDIAVALAEYIVENRLSGGYDNTWLGCRKDGPAYRFVRNNQTGLASDSALWDIGEPMGEELSDMSDFDEPENDKDHCVYLNTGTYGRKTALDTTRPYGAMSCIMGWAYPLCEVVSDNRIP
ncbi:unnamed protein product, partial [Meganyctiphanes norvegica]